MLPLPAFSEGSLASSQGLCGSIEMETGRTSGDILPGLGDTMTCEVETEARLKLSRGRLRRVVRYALFLYKPAERPYGRLWT